MLSYLIAFSYTLENFCKIQKYVKLDTKKLKIKK